MEQSPETKARQIIQPLIDDGSSYSKKYKEAVAKISMLCENEERLTAANVLHEFLTELEYKYKLSEQIKSSDSNIIKSIQNAILADGNLKDLITEKKDIDAFIQELETEIGYQKYSNVKGKNSFTMLYKECEVNYEQCIKLKFEAELEIPMMSLIGCFYETELYPRWFPWCKQSVLISHPRRAKKAVYTYFKTPPPMKNREALIVGYGINNLEANGTCIIYAKSITEEEIKGEKLPPHRSHPIRIRVHSVGVELKAISKTLVRVRSIICIDPMLKTLDLRLLFWLLKLFAKYLFKKALRIARTFDFSSIFAGKEFYEFIKKKLDEYFARSFKE